jgi:hypothetical protein
MHTISHKRTKAHEGCFLLERLITAGVCECTVINPHACIATPVTILQVKLNVPVGMVIFITTIGLRSWIDLPDLLSYEHGE